MGNKKSILKLNSATSIICFATVFALIFAEHYLSIITLSSTTVYTVLSVMVFLLLKPELATQYFIMLVPFAGAVHIKEIALFYLTIVLFKSWIVKKCTTLKAGTLFSFLILLILQLIATARCNDKIQTIVYLAFVMGCVIYWSMDFFDRQSCVAFLKSYVISAALMAVFMIALTVKLAPVEKIVEGVVRIGEDAYFENTAFHTGANGLGLTCLFSTAIVSFLLFQKQINKLLSIFVIIIFVVTGFLTQSRAFIFGCLFFVFYLMFFYSRSIVRATKTVLMIGVVAFVAIFLINYLYPNTLAHFSERFLADDITNGRTDIFGAYFKSWFDDPISMLFGAGLLTYPSVLGSEVNYISSHNATQEVLLAWGIFGLIAVVLWFVSLVSARGIKNCFGTKMQALFPLFILLFMVQSIRIFSTYNSIFLVGVALFCIMTATQESE